MQWSPGTGLTPGRAGAVVARREHRRYRRPCHPRARSIGPWRSLRDNYGPSRDALSWAIEVTSRLNGVPGRAFQARDRWGHIGATSGPRTTGSQRTTAVTSGPASCQLTGHIRPDSAGRRKRPAVPDTEAVMGAAPGASLSRHREPVMGGNQAVQAPLRSVRAGSVSQRSSTGIGGHQWSPTVRRNRRSLALRLMQLG